MKKKKFSRTFFGGKGGGGLEIRTWPLPPKKTPEVQNSGPPPPPKKKITQKFKSTIFWLQMLTRIFSVQQSSKWNSYTHRYSMSSFLCHEFSLKINTVAFIIETVCRIYFLNYLFYLNQTSVLETCHK